MDTDVVVAALRSPTGASAAIIALADEGKVTLLLSVPLVLEYEATCSLAEHRLAAGVSKRDVDEFLDDLMVLAEQVEAYFLWRPRLRDPGDEMVLEAAVNGRADAIVSFNHRDFAAVPQEFGIALLRPADVMRRMRS